MSITNQAHLRLNHLKMAVSPDSTLMKVNQFGNGFDIKVKEWKNSIESFHRGTIYMQMMLLWN